MAELPILVVEDDVALREALVDTLELGGLQVLTAGDGEEALSVLRHEAVGLVLSDGQMKPMDGYRLFHEIRRRALQVPFMLMTAYGAVARAVALLRAGACHYLTKPFEPDVLLAEVNRHRMTLPADESQPPAVVAVAKASRDVFELARRVAASEATVLINGESGVGKEVMARFLHCHSPRRLAPFIAVNCAAIPEALFEATLFGHEKGAFTGAVATYQGKFEQAQGGTLLLDEISEMPLSLQAKLLRVLQERELERVGGSRTVKLDIRILATTNRDLAGEVAAGRFRADLYYRVNVFPLTLPPLRQRRADIVPLAESILCGLARRSKRLSPGLSQAAIAKLTAYDWPGNIRELENVLQRAEILACGEEIDCDSLHFTLVPAPATTVVELGQMLKSEIVRTKSSDETESQGIRSLEKQYILDTLQAVNGVRRLAAERLGISERTLRYKLARWRETGDVETSEPACGGDRGENQ